MRSCVTRERPSPPPSSRWFAGAASCVILLYYAILYSRVFLIHVLPM